jgi:anti-sigma B factor antagonist
MGTPFPDAAGGLRISSRREGNVTVLSLDGELDLANAPDLSAALADAGNGAAEPLVLDMAGVSFVDSTGVRVLLEAQMAGQHRVIAIMAPSRAVTRVLDLTRLRGRFLEINATGDLAHLDD